MQISEMAYEVAGELGGVLEVEPEKGGNNCKLRPTISYAGAGEWWCQAFLY